MAERRPPGFNVDLGFYDSDEVLSIPRKVRAAAIGIWALCGSFSANKMTDGYLSAEALRDRGCTPAIRTALLSTTKADGTPSPLWVDAGEGAIRFTRWAKWQRTATEIKAYRDSEAERKRVAREARKNTRKPHVDATYEPRDGHVDATYGSDEAHVPLDMDATRGSRNDNASPVTSGDTETSGRTSAGHPQSVRTEDGDPRARTKTETKTETEIKSFGHLGNESALNVAEPRADLSAPVSQSASRLVNDIIGNGTNGYSAAVLTKLRINASQLVHEVGAEVTAEALRVWKTKTHLGPDALSALTAEAAKVIHDRNNGSAQPTSKIRSLVDLTREQRALEQAELETVTVRKELT